MKIEFSLFLLLIAFFSACNNDDDSIPEPPDPATIQEFSIVPLFNGGDFNYETEYEVGQTRVKFTRFAFYISQISYQNIVSNIHPPQPDAIYLFEGDTVQMYQSENVPVGQYIQAYYSIGLSNSINHIDPTQAEYPLNQPWMHWGWNPEEGYKFVNIEGIYDSNGDGSVEANEEIFEYHCATDQLFTSFIEPIEDGISSQEFIRIEVDVHKLFEGVDIPESPVQHGATAVNDTIIVNFKPATTFYR